MSQLETMGWEVEGKVARVVFNRPELLNAMSNEATTDINIIADGIAKDEGVRVVVITGSGRAIQYGNRTEATIGRSNSNGVPPPWGARVAHLRNNGKNRYCGY